jgi:hypothetical protein
MLASANPAIIARTGIFKIGGDAITVITAPFPNGNIALSPDGEGKLLVRSAAPEGNFINNSNLNVVKSNLISANVGNNNTNYNFMRFTNGDEEKLYLPVNAVNQHIRSIVRLYYS